MDSYLLSLLIFIPLAVALILLLLPARYVQVFKWMTLLATLLQLGVAIFVYINFEKRPEQIAQDSEETTSQLIQAQLSEKVEWIQIDMGSLGTLSIDYNLGVDGLSISMVLLSVLVLTIGAISSWKIHSNVKGYFLLYLLLSSSVVGCFVALDFFLFYLFFEFMLLPMYFLIGMWGGPRREYAAIKFFLYTLLGSIFILIAIIGLYVSVIDPLETAVSLGLASNVDAVTPQLIEQVQNMLAEGQIASQYMVRTFSMIAMTDAGNFIPGTILSLLSQSTLLGVSVRLWAFLALLIGFAIKLPAVPLHTWLPDAHVEAPTPISVVLAGILLKIGAYGILRTAYSIFPEGAVYYAWWIGLFGLIAIIYGGMNALAQKDVKKLIAYSSVSHMGFVLLGLASITVEGISGSIYQMFSHGLISSMLFLIAGVLYDRTHDRMIAHYGGLTARMPYFTGLVVIAFFASLGLPGFSGFVAEVLVFLGAFNSATLNELLPRWMPILATFGLILGAAYYLWTLQRMFFGTYYVRDSSWTPKLKDLNAREYIMLVPLALAIIAFGIFPQILIDMIDVTVSKFVYYVNTTGQENLQLILR
ncbi:NADH-quinone oxidoreductase subunit M [Catalinimonas alkaloidigena]|uniref:complex I subunit 4 family protein n=1 Tax=Catalinimonas alkaloidigena TaxID=1075417 RepID=UPI0024057EAF|nr:NADH-quinone oxidoreductase subunit M [Catalinimonas alkaloidigena]MDF9794793.1 NADH-quinone oxidoreductase subunit M [Catalinimonas alkaloidigena]